MLFELWLVLFGEVDGFVSLVCLDSPPLQFLV